MTDAITQEVHTDQGKVDGHRLFSIPDRGTDRPIIKVGDPVQYESQSDIYHITSIGLFTAAEVTTDVPAAFLAPGIVVTLENKWGYWYQIHPIPKEVIDAKRVMDCPECPDINHTLCDYHESLTCPDCPGLAGMIPGCSCP